MTEKLILITSVSSLAALVWFIAMRITPGRGLMKTIEKMFAGFALCWLCQLLVAPLGLHIVQSPFSALAAGWLGLPGVVLSVFLAFTP